MEIHLTGATNADVTGERGVGVIEDDDALPVVSIADVTAVEPLDGDSGFVCVLQLSRPSAQPTNIDWSTANDTAVAPGDYVADSGTAHFNAGETTKSVRVYVNADGNFTEGAEEFLVRLSNPDGLTIGDGTASVTISDPVSTPNVRLDDTTAVEGNVASFSVSLSAPSSQTVSIGYRTVSFSATTADYTSRNSTVSITPGQTRVTIDVPTKEDSTSELTEKFGLELISVTNANLLNPLAFAFISDDDPLPTLRISDVSMAEPVRGQTLYKFRVTLSAPSGQSVSFNWTTADGTARAGSDYLAKSGSVTIPIGSTVKEAVVTVLADGVSEGDESFQVRVSSVVGATVADDTGVGTIL
jgi:hypothetical protein